MHERTHSATPTSVAVVDRSEPGSDGQTSGPGTAPATAAAVRQIPTRRISFDETLAELPKHFAADQDLLLSHIFAAMSAFFPDGEDYFVRSVRRFRSEITDPELTAQVAGFIGQEAVHGRQHRAFNQRLGELGYPTPVFERLTRRTLAIRERIFTPKANLAATAALEHFTATFAELLLTDEEARLAPGDAGVRDLLLWHALEESEHKAVAFDVYRAVGGSERTRIITMKGIRIGFILALSRAGGRVRGRGQRDLREGRLRASAKRLRSSPALRREIWDRLREYDRAGLPPRRPGHRRAGRSLA